jgi:hypothetical protein
MALHGKQGSQNLENEKYLEGGKQKVFHPTYTYIDDFKVQNKRDQNLVYDFVKSNCNEFENQKYYFNGKSYLLKNAIGRNDGKKHFQLVESTYVNGKKINEKNLGFAELGCNFDGIYLSCTKSKSGSFTLVHH